MQLVLVLYGEGCVAQHSLVLLQRHAETYGFIMLAPTSMEQTWDIIARRRYGIDSTEIDDLLDTAFDRHIVDPARLAIAVFSDGASTPSRWG